MPRINRGLAAGIAVTVAFVVATPTLSAASDEEGAISRLEARATDLSERIHHTPIKGGTSTRAKLHEQLRAVEREIILLERGGSIDADRLATLMGDRHVGADQPSLLERVSARRTSIERRLVVGPKMGMHARETMREELDRLDGVIAALESGETVEVATLNAALGSRFAGARRSPSQSLHEHQVRLASLRRHLTGHKMGVVERGRVRDEIGDLEATIARIKNDSSR